MLKVIAIVLLAYPAVIFYAFSADDVEYYLFNAIDFIKKIISR